MNASLEQEFNEEVLSLFTKTGKATGYWPRYFLRKARKVGGYKLAQDLLKPTTKVAFGFGKLEETNHLDLSVEYLALQPRWSPLFTDQEHGLPANDLNGRGTSLCRKRSLTSLAWLKGLRIQSGLMPTSATQRQGPRVLPITTLSLWYADSISLPSTARLQQVSFTSTISSL